MKNTISHSRFWEIDGHSILDAILATLLVGSLLYVGNTSIRAFSKSVGHAELKGKIFDLQRYFVESLDCPSSLAGKETACTNGEYVALLDKAGAAIGGTAAPWPTVFRDFSLRGKCQKDSDGTYLTIEFAVGADSTGTQFRESPQFKQALAWRELFTQKVRCTAASPPTTSAGPYVIKRGYAVPEYFEKITRATPLAWGGLAISMTLNAFQAETTCKRLGFTKVKGSLPSGHDYSSPENNTIVDWTTAGDTLYARNADAAGNPIHFSFIGWVCE